MRWWMLVGLIACGGDDELDCERVTWFVDEDGDGFGAPGAITDCAEARPDNAVNIPGDCDDADPDFSPNAAEVCNGVDDDCDGRVDHEDTDVAPEELLTYYVDADQDGFGSMEEDAVLLACEQPPGASKNANDCDDGDAARFPGAEETCYSPADMNCDGRAPLDDIDNDDVVACLDCDDDDADQGAAGVWYRDADTDGFGDPTMSTTSCVRPPDTADNGDDCDDANIATNPNGTEGCDGIDNDCDSLIDDDDDSLTGAPNWYADLDGDKLGDPNNFATQCDMPSNTVTNDDDCDDTTDLIGLAPSWYDDDDGDGFGDLGSVPQVACLPPIDTVDNDEDCDDTDALINPNTVWYADTDEDGFGDNASTLTQCDQPVDYVLDDTDCDDTTHLVYPGRFDFDDDIDNDCDMSFDEDVGTEQYTASDIQAIVDLASGTNGGCDNCHTSLSNGSLNMSSVWADTVNVPSDDVPTMDLVEPGDLRNSYLWRKMQNTHLDITGGAGAQMPIGGTVSTADQDTIETWILEGAIP